MGDGSEERKSEIETDTGTRSPLPRESNSVKNKTELFYTTNKKYWNLFWLSAKKLIFNIFFGSRPDILDYNF